MTAERDALLDVKQQNAELMAQVEALSMSDEDIEGLIVWLSEFEQSVDVGCGTIESPAAALIKHLVKLKQTPTQCLRQIQADAGEKVITECQLILERVPTTYRENPGMGFSSKIEDKTAKQLKQELRKDFATYASRVKAGEL